VDFRRIYRKQRPLIPKALGVFGTVGVRINALTGDETPLAHASAALELLDQDRAAGNRAWGYHWDVQTRWSFYAGGSPNVVVTTFAADGLVAGAHALNEPRLARRAREAAEWILEELYVEDGGFFAYHPGNRSVIHNASLLGARAVHELLDGEGRDAATRALERTLAGQSTDGSWPYGEDANLTFIDSFHTGFVLDCLCSLRDLDSSVDDALRRGADFYSEHFFGSDGSTPLWPGKPYPKDAHSAGTGLTTLARLVEGGYASEDLLRRVTDYVLGDVVVDGHAIHRRGRHMRSTVRYIRWCDAHVALGLVNSARVLSAERREGARGTLPAA
jgi:hypothetical protein